MNKKANVQDIMLNIIADLVILSIIILAFFSVNMKIKDSTLHDQRIAARNLAFTRDAALASPQDIQTFYIIDPEYTANIDENCKVAVQLWGKKEIPATFYCANTASAIANKLMVSTKEKETQDEAQHYAITKST